MMTSAHNPSFSSFSPWLMVVLCCFIGAPVLAQFPLPVTEWNRGYGGNGWEELNSIQQTADNGYIMTGFSGSSDNGDVTNTNNGNGDFWAAKIDQDGNLEWQQLYGGNQLDRARIVRQTTDGGFIFGGWSASGISGNKSEPSRGLDDYWVVKTDVLGNIQWEHTYGGDGLDQLFDLIQTSDGGYLLGGNSTSAISGERSQPSRGGQDWWVIKIDASGNIQWDMAYGGSDEERLNELIEAPDGNYVIAGGTRSDVGGDVTTALLGVKDFWLLKVDAMNAGILWERRYGGTDEDEVNSFTMTSDGGYLLGGGSRSDAYPGQKADNRRNLVDMWIVKTDPTGAIQWERTLSGNGANAITNCYTVKENSIGNFLIGGVSDSNAGFEKSDDSKGGYDFWMLYVDPMGNILWDLTLGGDQPESMENLFQTSDGGYLFAGHSSTDVSGDKTDPGKGLNDFWILKTGCNLTLDLPDVSVCAGEEVVVDAYDPSCISCSWQWEDGNTTDSIRSLIFNTDVTFRVTLTDGAGCARIDDLNVTALARPSLDLGNDQSICNGSSLLLDAGTAASYDWSTNDQTQQITVDQAGQYRVTITDANGCTAEDSIQVSFSSPFVVDLGPDSSFCQGGSIVLDAGNPGSSYQWSNGGTNQTRRFDQPGTYAVTVTDNTNCQVSDTVTLSVYATPEVVNLQAECDLDNLFYTVRFEIIGGDASTYQVSGGGRLNGNIFMSDPIPRNQVYSFFLDDGRACGPVQIDGQFDCACSSDAGLLQRDPIVLCGFESFELTLQGNGQLDSNDSRQYILHDGDANNLGTILATSTTGRFENLLGLNFGQLYFATTLVGNADGNGGVDPRDGCLSAAEGVPIVFQRPPTASLIPLGALTLTCASPSLDLDATASTSVGPLDFEWTTDDGNFTQAGNVPLASIDAPGTYQLIITEQQSGCSDTISIDVQSAQDFPQIEIATPDELNCIETTVQLDATGTSAGPDFLYDWSGPSLLTGADGLTPTVDQPGAYTFVVTNTTNGCTRSQEVVVVADVGAPSVDAGVDVFLDCTTDIVLLEGQYTSSGVAAVEWTSPDGRILSNGQNLQIEVDQVGTYVLQVTDVANGCTATDAVQVLENTDLPTAFQLNIQPPSCFGEANGRVEVVGINGGMEPMLYSLDGENFSPRSFFANLEAGNYRLWVQDANGCELDTIVLLENPKALVLSMGNNDEIQLGDSKLLNPQINQDLSALDTFYWAPADGLDCLTCWPVSVQPSATTTYQLTVVDSFGCVVEERITVNVRKERRVFIPSAFSPNGDGINERFTVYAGPEVAEIKSFRVFDRWGELVFERVGFLPNQELEGWDGRLGGQLMDNGVYIYYAEIRFVDGWEELHQGDVTLVR